MLEKLRLYHTNDLHSHFENWPKIVHYIEQKRNEHEKDGEETLVFDIGDHMDRFQMITEATFGKANVDLLNRLEIDAAPSGIMKELRRLTMSWRIYIPMPRFPSLCLTCLTRTDSGRNGPSPT